MTPEQFVVWEEKPSLRRPPYNLQEQGTRGACVCHRPNVTEPAYMPMASHIQTQNLCMHRAMFTNEQNM